MNHAKNMSREEARKVLSEIYQKIDRDPEVRKEGEQYQKQYGTLTEKKLRRTITI